MANRYTRQIDGKSADAPIVFMTGSFDPFHRGHLAAVEIALSELDPERVLLFPQWRRAGKELAPMGRRLREIVLQTAHLDRVQLDLARYAALKKGGLFALHLALLDHYSDRRLIQLSGSDSFMEALNSGGVDEGGQLGIESAVVPRPGYDLPPDLPSHVHRLSSSRVAVSSSDLRTLRYGGPWG
jgi:nicotinic acid mononucleotide adenylyltransferase